MSYRRDIPKLNQDKFKALQELIKLHPRTIGDTGLHFLENKYVAPQKTLTMDQMVNIKNYNAMMIYIVSSLNYIEFTYRRNLKISMEEMKM